MARPAPAEASQSVMARFASAVGSPFREISSLAEPTATPSPAQRGSETPSGGETTSTIGSSKAVAKAWSRASCAGTAMIAPVP